MRAPSLFLVAAPAALAGSLAIAAITTANAEPPKPAPLPMGQVYDGPVANCPWKPGMDGVLISSCSGGQDCWENGGWVCHMPKSERPDLKAKADAEWRAKQNAFKSAVDAEVLRLGGEYRRPEAERLVKMRMDAEAARRRSQPNFGSTSTAPSPGSLSPAPAKPPEREMCTFPATSSTISSDYYDTKSLAAAGLRKRLIKACSFGVNGTIAGPVQCRTLPTIRYANGTKEPGTECQARYTCPSYKAPCAAKGGGKSARARAG